MSGRYGKYGKVKLLERLRQSKESKIQLARQVNKYLKERTNALHKREEKEK